MFKLSVIATETVQIDEDERTGKIFVAFNQPQIPISTASTVCEDKLNGMVAPVTSYERIKYFSKVLPQTIKEMYAGLKDYGDVGFFFTKNGI